MHCTHCKNGKLKHGNNFPYIKILVEYYKCEECGHENKITYPDKDKKYEK